MENGGQLCCPAPTKRVLAWHSGAWPENTASNIHIKTAGSSVRASRHPAALSSWCVQQPGSVLAPLTEKPASRGAANSGRFGASSITRPRDITITRSELCFTTDRSSAMKITASRCSRHTLASRSMAYARIDTFGAEIGSSRISSLGSTINARAIPMR